MNYKPYGKPNLNLMGKALQTQIQIAQADYNITARNSDDSRVREEYKRKSLYERIPESLISDVHQRIKLSFGVILKKINSDTNDELVATILNKSFKILNDPVNTVIKIDSYDVNQLFILNKLIYTMCPGLKLTNESIDMIEDYGAINTWDRNTLYVSLILLSSMRIIKLPKVIFTLPERTNKYDIILWNIINSDCLITDYSWSLLIQSSIKEFSEHANAIFSFFLTFDKNKMYRYKNPFPKSEFLGKICEDIFVDLDPRNINVIIEKSIEKTENSQFLTSSRQQFAYETVRTSLLPQDIDIRSKESRSRLDILLSDLEMQMNKNRDSSLYKGINDMVVDSPAVFKKFFPHEPKMSVLKLIKWSLGWEGAINADFIKFVIDKKLTPNELTGQKDWFKYTLITDDLSGKLTMKPIEDNSDEKNFGIFDKALNKRITYPEVNLSNRDGNEGTLNILTFTGNSFPVLIIFNEPEIHFSLGNYFIQTTVRSVSGVYQPGPLVVIHMSDDGIDESYRSNHSWILYMSPFNLPGVGTVMVINGVVKVSREINSISAKDKLNLDNYYRNYSKADAVVDEMNKSVDLSLKIINDNITWPMGDLLRRRDLYSPPLWGVISKHWCILGLDQNLLICYTEEQQHFIVKEFNRLNINSLIMFGTPTFDNITPALCDNLISFFTNNIFGSNLSFEEKSYKDIICKVNDRLIEKIPTREDEDKMLYTSPYKLLGIEHPLYKRSSLRMTLSKYDNVSCRIIPGSIPKLKFNAILPAESNFDDRDQIDKSIDLITEQFKETLPDNIISMDDNQWSALINKLIIEKIDLVEKSITILGTDMYAIPHRIVQDHCAKYGMSFHGIQVPVIGEHPNTTLISMPPRDIALLFNDIKDTLDIDFIKEIKRMTYSRRFMLASLYAQAINNILSEQYHFSKTFQFVTVCYNKQNEDVYLNFKSTYNKRLITWDSLKRDAIAKMREINNDLTLEGEIKCSSSIAVAWANYSANQAYLRESIFPMLFGPNGGMLPSFISINQYRLLLSLITFSIECRFKIPREIRQFMINSFRVSTEFKSYNNINRKIISLGMSTYVKTYDEWATTKYKLAVKEKISLAVASNLLPIYTFSVPFCSDHFLSEEQSAYYTFNFLNGVDCSKLCSGNIECLLIKPAKHHTTDVIDCLEYYKRVKMTDEALFSEQYYKLLKNAILKYSFKIMEIGEFKLPLITTRFSDLIKTFKNENISIPKFVLTIEDCYKVLVGKKNYTAKFKGLLEDLTIFNSSHFNLQTIIYFYDIKNHDGIKDQYCKFTMPSNSTASHSHQITDGKYILPRDYCLKMLKKSKFDKSRHDIMIARVIKSMPSNVWYSKAESLTKINSMFYQQAREVVSSEEFTIIHDIDIPTHNKFTVSDFITPKMLLSKAKRKTQSQKSNNSQIVENDKFTCKRVLLSKNSDNTSVFLDEDSTLVLSINKSQNYRYNINVVCCTDYDGNILYIPWINSNFEIRLSNPLSKRDIGNQDGYALYSYNNGASISLYKWSNIHKKFVCIYN